MVSDAHRKLDKEVASGNSEVHTIVVEEAMLRGT